MPWPFLRSYDFNLSSSACIRKGCRVQRDINIYTTKHPLTFEKSVGKPEVASPTLTSGNAFHLGCPCCHEIFTQELNICPHPFVVPNVCPEDHFLPCGTLYITSSWESSFHPPPSFTPSTPNGGRGETGVPEGLLDFHLPSSCGPLHCPFFSPALILCASTCFFPFPLLPEAALGMRRV